MAEHIPQRAGKFTMEAAGTWEQEEKPRIPYPSGKGGAQYKEQCAGK